MGREGRTQRALERRNNVSINIGTETNPDETQTITIRGQKENQEHTIDDIQTKIDNISDSHTNKEKQTICRFYERGNCKKGDMCNFDHPRPATEAEAPVVEATTDQGKNTAQHTTDKE